MVVINPILDVFVPYHVLVSAWICEETFELYNDTVIIQIGILCPYYLCHWTFLIVFCMYSSESSYTNNYY